MNRGALAVFGLGIPAAIGGVAFLLSRTPDDAPLLQETAAPAPPSHAPWVEIVEEGTGCPYVIPPSLLWLAIHHNDDGSWGGGPVELEGRPLGKTGVTALALLSFFSSGFCEVSRDRVTFEGGDWSFGAEVREAIVWLERDQREDGTFRSAEGGALEQALAAMALSDAYGVAAQSARKRPAQLAIDALLRMRTPDGSWEDAGPAAWALLALNSAQLSGFSVDPATFHRALRSWNDPVHPGGAVAQALGRSPEGAAAVERLLSEAPGRGPGKDTFWYLGTIALLFQQRRAAYEPDYQTNSPWGRWNAILDTTLAGSRKADGSFPGKSLEDTIVRTSLGQLSWTAREYYRYVMTKP